MTTTKTIDDFSYGDNVNVKSRPNDSFTNDFTGHVCGIRMAGHHFYIQVRDQDGDVWDCDPEQLSFSSDDIMHS